MRGSPLSYGQEQLWYLDRLLPDRSLYNVPCVYELRGRVDVAALEAAIDEIVRRHEVLRTKYVDVDGSPRQVVLPHRDVEVRPVFAKREVVREWATESFSLSDGHVFRARLLRLGHDAHVLALVFHHVCVDEWSLGVFFRELDQLYSGATLEPLELQYSDFAARQRTDPVDDDLAYWRAQLRDVADPIALGCRARGRSPRSHEGAVETFTVRRPASGTRSVAVLLAALQVVLWRYTEEDVFAVGVPTSGRGDPALAPLIGYFVNTLPVRAELGDDPTGEELVERVRSSLLEGYNHQRAPLPRIVAESGRDRQPAETPFAQVLFHLYEPAVLTRLGDLRVTPVHLPTTTAKFDLAVELTGSGDMLEGSVSYRTEVFDAEAIRRFVGHYTAAVRELEARPATRASSLRLTSPEERRWLLRAGRGPRAPIREGRLHELVESSARERRHDVAFSDGSATMTYGELVDATSELSGELRVAAGEFVPVVVDAPTMAVAVAFLAVLKAGAAFVPLDGRSSDDWRDEVVRELSPRAIVSATGAAPTVEAVGAHGPLRAPDGAVYAYYTSGTTGRPKGPVNLHRGVVNRLDSMSRRYGCSAEDVVLVTSAPLFDAFVWQVFWPLLSGARAAFLGGAIEDVGIRRVVERLAEERATVTDFVPSVFNVLVGYLREAPERYEALRSLRQVLVGGERMSPAAVAELKRNLPHVGITNTYGATEASIGSVFHELSQRVDEEEDIPIGRPIDNTTAYVVDRHGELAPVGAIGEIQLGGACVGAGYLGSEDATRRSFVDGRYRTGDRGRWAADGTLEFLGRADDQVKVRGVRVGLAHVAAAVARHPDVADAYVAPLADGLVAYVVLRDRRALDEPAMRDHLRRVLPRRLVPDRLVAVEALPLTSAGKVDRSRLPAAVPRERTATAPRTDTEARVQRVWEDVLGHGPIGVDEDFFEVGGHSLAALRLHAALERDLDVELPLSLLVGGGTIETVAAAVEAARDRQAASPIVELGGSGSPSIVFVHPSSGLLEPYLSLARRLRTRHACYGVRAAVRGCGDVDLGELARAHADAIVAAGLGGSILVGWSIGGLLALEIARCGVGAPLVVLLDTRPPAAGARRADPLSELFGEGRAGDYGGEQLASILEVHELLVAAARRYAHSPPDVPVVLVRAGDGELGWGEAASGWRVETTPGDHHSMLREPHVAALADLLLDAIAEAGLAAAAAS